MIHIQKAIKFFVLIIGIGFLLNVAAFLLPQEPIHRNIVDSVASFKKEGTFPQLIQNYRGSILDNNSDAWVLLMCDYSGDENVFEKAMGGYYNTYSVKNSGAIGTDNLQVLDMENPVGSASYARYWHGWLFFIRFLLLFFDYSGIRAINMFLQFIMTCFCFILMDRRGLGKYSMAFAAALLVIVPVATALSFEYSFVYYIILFGMSCMLRLHEKIKKGISYPVFFMILGMITSYFDFLTYPIAALGFPLTLYFLIEGGEKEKVKVIVMYSIAWGIGYIGMWAAKWGIGSLILHDNIFGNAVKQAALRTSHTMGHGGDYADKIDYFSTVKGNLEVVFRAPYLLLFLISTIVYLYRSRKAILAIKIRRFIIEMIPYLLICSMPFVWWFLLMNHSYMHSHFTYRIVSVTVFAGLCGIGKMGELCK